MSLPGSVIEGRCWVFGDEIDTDVIIPTRYVRLRDLTEIARHAMEPIEPDFGTKCEPGDIVVGGESFGAGSSREAAALVFKILGVRAIVAESFARIFFRNCINNGLYAIEGRGVRSVVNSGDRLRIELGVGRIINLTNGRETHFMPFSQMIVAIIEAGGLVPFLKNRSNVRREY